MINMGMVKDAGHWHIAILLAGVAITVAAIAVRWKPLVLIGLGMISGGIGEMRNHPYQEQVHFNAFGEAVSKVSGWKRSPSVGGLALDIIGGFLFVGGLVWFVVE